MQTLATDFDDAERGTEQATFSTWLYRIVKGSFGSLSMEELKTYQEVLELVYKTITYEKNGMRYYSSRYHHAMVESNIRKAFCEGRSFQTKGEQIPQKASLLNIANFTSVIYTETPSSYYPSQDVVERIILDDKGKLKMKPSVEAAILALEADDNAENQKLAKTLRTQNSAHPQKERSFHYLPYCTDSSFEQIFLAEVLTFSEITSCGLEVYYNGDRAMTEFKIKCYKKSGKQWRYIGMYTPDFLIIQRKDDAIYRILIAETKGKIYANDPEFQDKKTFVEAQFTSFNNKAFGYERFEYLYLEDTLSEHDRLQKTHEKICEFFGVV